MLTLNRKEILFMKELIKFHKRNQKEGESVEEYIRHLYELSEHADFADREFKVQFVTDLS